MLKTYTAKDVPRSGLFYSKHIIMMQCKGQIYHSNNSWVAKARVHSVWARILVKSHSCSGRRGCTVGVQN